MLTPGYSRACDNVRPVIEDGIIRSSGDTILGADGKAAIAVVLETLNRIIEQDMHIGL